MEGREVKKRGAKTRNRQYQLYVEELENNELFRTNKIASNNPTLVEDSWKKLTLSLNSVGGPQRNTDGWKKIFADCESNAKKKARHIKQMQMKSGGGPPEKPLSDLREIIGKVTIKGIPGIPEIGIVNNESQVTEEILPEAEKIRAGKRNAASPTPSTPQLPKKISQPTIANNNKTLFSSVQTAFNENKPYEEKKINVLNEINTNLVKLIDIEEKKYQLKKLTLELQYPDVEICEF